MRYSSRGQTGSAQRPIMSEIIDRRSVLIALALGLAGPSIEALAADDRLKLGRPVGFSFDLLKSQARRLAANPYAAQSDAWREVLSKIDYDAWGKITFNTDYAAFRDTRFPVTFFHLGKYFQTSVDM